MNGSHLVIGAAAALVAAAHLRVRAAGRAGSRGLSNVGVISDETLQDQLSSGAEYDEIVPLVDAGRKRQYIHLGGPQGV